MMPIPVLRRSWLAILSLVLAPSVSILSAADRSFTTSPTLATEATTLVKLLELYHYNRAAVHSSDYGEVIPDYMTSLDGQHLFFLETDKNAFTTKFNGATVYSQVAYQGDISAAYEIFNTYSRRVQSRINWIFAELKKPIDLTGNETFAADRTKSEWPADMADADDLWHRRIKYEMILELLNTKPKSLDVKLSKTTDSTLFPNAADKAQKSDAEAKADKPETATSGDVPADPAKAKAAPAIASTAAAPADPVEKAKEVIRKRYEGMLKNLNDIEGSDLAEYYLTSIAALYDPHSNYWSAPDYEEFGIQMKLQLVGIGAMLRLKDDYCTIEELVPGGPAELSHQIKPNDKIVAVAQDNQEPVDIIGMQLRKIVAMIRGEKGSHVHLIIESAGTTDTATKKEIIITRDVVKLNSARAHGALFQVPDADGKPEPIGVITLPEFYSEGEDTPGSGPKISASQDVAALIKQMKAVGVKGMVLDLRHNGGGFLGEAINVAGLFIPRGPVVQVFDSSGEKQVDSSDRATVAYDGQLAVLTDRFSASASEIVAGALQNYGRAIVIGDTSTHGKGTVQQVLEMKNLTRELAASTEKTGAAKITIQKFYLPNGSSTQLKGVLADIPLPSIDDVLPIGESSLPHALIWDRKQSAPSFTGQALDIKVLTALRESSQLRQAKLPEFAYLKRNVEWFKARQNQKLVMLNLEERKTQKANDDTFIKSMKAERDDLAKSDYAHQEFWVAPKPPPKAKAAKTADDGAEDGSDDPVLSTDDDDPYPKMDVYLREALRVVDDAIDLGRDHQYWVSDHAPLTAATKG